MMKKLFTSLLLLGVAITGWASVTASYDEGTKTLTINYKDEGNSTELQNFNNSYTGAETIVLTGDWSNKHLSKIGSIVGSCSGNVFLNLSACRKMVSKVVPTEGAFETNWDWATKKPVFIPSSDNPLTVPRTGTATKSREFFIYGSNPWTGIPYYNEQDGKYYPNENCNAWEVLTPGEEIFVDEKGNKLSEESVTTIDNGDGTYSYTYSYEEILESNAFTFKDGNFYNNEDKLSGIAFPNHSNFTAIPDGFATSKMTDNHNLKTVIFGDSIQWIGDNAFNGCDSLHNVTFPQTLRVIGVDAFYGCINFTEVDLRVRDLVKVDAAAFNMVRDYNDDNTAWADFAESERPPLLNKLTTVHLPDTTNTTLLFFANQVFSSSLITELDFSHCLGIKHFGYDGEKYFGETVPEGISNTNRTFTWHRFLTKVTLPPNLLRVADECFNKCTALNELYFTGTADYNKENCPTINELKNPLTIGNMACYTLPLDTLKLSNNVTVIGERAFAKTALSKVVIPASVDSILTKAFEDCTDAAGNMTLKTVVFEEIDSLCAPCQHAKTYIKEEAFLENTAISDVYVNTVVDIDCENHGFPFEVTFAQGNAEAASTGQAATLHFPAGHEEHYVNLNHYLTNDTASNAGLFQAWLVRHLALAQDQSSGYGWYEFINTGSKSVDKHNPDPEYDPDPENPDQLPLILRTFSDPKYARIVPDGMRAYIVNHVEKDTTNNNYVLTLQRLSVIPAQTGVILFGQPNSTSENGKHTLSMSVVQFAPGHGQPLRRDYWDMLSTNDQHFKNYLMPIIDSCMIRTVVDGNQTFTKTNLLTVNPYEPYEKGADVKWRNFALNRMSETEHLKLDKDFGFVEKDDNFAGFFRILPGTYKSGYAYLHLSNLEYDSPTGAECVVTEDPEYFTEYYTSGVPFDPRGKEGYSWWNNPNTWNNMIDGWGTRKDKFNKPKAIQFLGEIDELDDTDGVVQMVIPENKMDEIFSISGMKVTNPRKGIYIKNGKKIFIK